MVNQIDLNLQSNWSETWFWNQTKILFNFIRIQIQNIDLSNLVIHCKYVYFIISVYTSLYDDEIDAFTTSSWIIQCELERVKGSIDVVTASCSFLSQSEHRSIGSYQNQLYTAQ